MRAFFILRLAFGLLLTGGLAQTEISAETFRHHFITTDLSTNNDWGYGAPALADFDKDGDLDFAFGVLGDAIYWFEYRGAEDWVRHRVGEYPVAQLGSAVLDVDRDGWPDILIGGHWYRNPQTPRTAPFTRHRFDSKMKRTIHDMVTADVDGDGAEDVVALGDEDGCFWYSVPDSPARDVDWPRTTITLSVLNDRDDIHSGFEPGGVADLDGDGDVDVVLPDRWYENQAKGTRWMRHRIEFGHRGPWGLSSRSWIIDLDTDGDSDIVMADGDGQNSGVAWMENDGASPPKFTANYLANRAPGTRGSFHSLVVADFDNDGDPDILVVEQEDDSIPPVGADPRWFIFENLDGKGARFVERVIFEGRLGGHDVQAGDVDGDGDIDIASKVWNLWPGNANGGKIHADYLENRTN